MPGASRRAAARVRRLGRGAATGGRPADRPADRVATAVGRGLGRRGRARGRRDTEVGLRDTAADRHAGPAGLHDTAAGRRDEVAGRHDREWDPRRTAGAGPLVVRTVGTVVAARRGAVAGRVRVGRAGRRRDGRRGAGRCDDRAGRPARPAGATGRDAGRARLPGWTVATGRGRAHAAVGRRIGVRARRASDGRRPAAVRPDSAPPAVPADERPAFPLGFAPGLAARPPGAALLRPETGFGALPPFGGLAGRAARLVVGTVPLSHVRPRRSGASAARRACPRR